MDSTDAGGNTYLIRPTYQNKFKPALVKECIRKILNLQLSEQQYNPEQIPGLTRSLAESINDKLKEVGFVRYKLVTQVVIGEQRGQGVKMASRCFWDADTDNYTEGLFANDSLFCVVAVFGCYFY